MIMQKMVQGAEKEKSPEEILLSDGLMAKAFPVKEIVKSQRTALSLDLVDISDHFSFPYKFN